MPKALRDVPQQGIELIKSFEGIPDGDPRTVNLDPYLDPLDIWTIGWGHAVTLRGRMLRGAENRSLARALFPGGITMTQAEALLRADLVQRSADVLLLVRVPLDDGQYAALMSFVFNCGSGNFKSSTLLKKLNARDYAGAADQFPLWNKGRRNGVLIELPGLTRRRKAERALFLGQDWRAAAVLIRSRGAPPPRRRRRLPPEVPVRPGSRRTLAAAKKTSRRRAR